MLLAVGIILNSCTTFFEKSIANNRVILDAPGANALLNSYNVLFHWQPVPNALSYELQIVTPSFDSINSYVLDSTIKSIQFPFTLKPGRYSWRVMAMNGSSNTAFSTFNFKIDTAAYTER